MEALRTVEVKGRKYNIGHLSPTTGSFLTKRLLRHFNDFLKGIDGAEADPNAPKPTDEDFAEQLIQQLLMSVNEEDFANIQRHALNIITVTDFVADRDFEQPIMLKSGVFCFKELNTDIGTIDYLTSQSLFANLTPFFTPTGLKAALRGEQVSSR